MKHYIIDTNFVHLDYFLRGTNITILTQSAKNLGHIVYMPMVVFDELIKQYRDEVSEQCEAYFKFLKGQNRLNEKRINYPEIDFEKQINSYEYILSQRCDEIGIKIIQYPSIGHREVVKRELDKRKPFKDSTKGYRDALIWESILEYSKTIAPDDTIILLSQNTDDFAKGKNTLHPDLVSDCQLLGFQENRITLISSFHEFIQNEIVPASQEMEELKQNLLATFTIGNIEIYKVIDTIHTRDSVQGLLTYDTDEGQPFLIPGVYETVELDYMSPPNLSIFDVRKISDSDILISIQIDVDIQVSCYIFKGDLALIDSDSMPYIFDYDWNDHYVAASDNASMSLHYDILVDSDLKNVNSYNQYVTHIKYETGFEYTI